MAAQHPYVMNYRRPDAKAFRAPLGEGHTDIAHPEGSHWTGTYFLRAQSIKHEMLSAANAFDQQKAGLIEHKLVLQNKFNSLLALHVRAAQKPIETKRSLLLDLVSKANVTLSMLQSGSSDGVVKLQSLEREFQAWRDLPQPPLQLPDLPEILGIDPSPSSTAHGSRLDEQKDTQLQLASSRRQPSSSAVSTSIIRAINPTSPALDSTTSTASLLRSSLRLSSQLDLGMVDSGLNTSRSRRLMDSSGKEEEGNSWQSQMRDAYRRMLLDIQSRHAADVEKMQARHANELAKRGKLRTTSDSKVGNSSQLDSAVPYTYRTINGITSGEILGSRYNQNGDPKEAPALITRDMMQKTGQEDITPEALLRMITEVSTTRETEGRLQVYRLQEQYDLKLETLMASLTSRDEEHKALVQQLSDLQQQLKNLSMVARNDLRRPSDQEGGDESQNKAIVTRSEGGANCKGLSWQKTAPPSPPEQELRVHCPRSRCSSPTKCRRHGLGHAIQVVDTGPKSPGQEHSRAKFVAAADQIKSPIRPPFRSPGRLKHSTLRRPESSRSGSAIKKNGVAEIAAEAVNQSQEKQQVELNQNKEENQHVSHRGQEVSVSGEKPNDLSRSGSCLNSWEDLAAGVVKPRHSHELRGSIQQLWSAMSNDARECIWCGLNDTISPGLCTFHPALLLDPGALLFGPEWQTCHVEAHTSDQPACFTKSMHTYNSVLIDRDKQGYEIDSPMPQPRAKLPASYVTEHEL
ncbi:hypothetical protein CEUSTIGMA_g509.t1 [Chlamydomonas eustigma]|uniref:Uncharacterized protein n=1 Tax=Chlamydomonas eustigma TaxID=1157962 RepID=A0A250WQT3_9CHLO|nr:hypothetical protein CEUSTIGMA_g509.t1 [Chlamydomonas eustigma]|eukprot:GAX73056.1 hypothetical protein CEUSTIGMA_g509.t1 [Chlamydomonas eustigma]